MNDKKMNVWFLSTYPPRACGIATFTQDLVRALSETGNLDAGIAAIDDAPYSYPSEVRISLPQQEQRAYPRAAKAISSSGADLLMVEHEFGIYGGRSGGYLLKLTDALRIPYCVTLHTVLPKPNITQKKIITALGVGCRKLITMSPASVETLRAVYSVPEGKIAVIHHGVPEIPLGNRDKLKHEEGLENRFVVSTFGLLSPGKGLEYGIGAIARAAKKHPEIIYLILGQTHPVVKKRFGEAYREGLKKEAAELGISENVRFVDRYLTKEEIFRYLSLSDVYMTPYLGKDQAVSGTLAYAVGCGRVIVSTPYPYAREMLAEGRGLLAGFRSSSSLAKCLLEVANHPQLQAEMEKITLARGKEMTWSRVAERYLGIFREAAGKKEDADV